MTSRNVANGMQNNRNAAGNNTCCAVLRPKNAQGKVISNPTNATISRRNWMPRVPRKPSARNGKVRSSPRNDGRPKDSFSFWRSVHTT